MYVSLYIYMRANTLCVCVNMFERMCIYIYIICVYGYLFTRGYAVICLMYISAYVRDS